MIPTYNEQQNLPHIVVRVLAATTAEVEVLVVDDASPDGTGVTADRIAATEPRVHVLHRNAKQGLGPAYIAGFRWALGRSYDAIVEMDADGSHHPEDLPRLLVGLGHADVVLGSRWVPGGVVEHWPRRRLLLSRAGNGYARALLGLPTRDVTGGFRAYRADALRRLLGRPVASQGYCFQIDLVHRAHAARMTLAEVPIVFTERTAGRSKMSGRIVVESLLRVTAWGLARPVSALVARADRGRPASAGTRPSSAGGPRAHRSTVGDPPA